MVKARTLWPGVESPPAPTGQGAEHPVYPCQSNCISSPDCHLLNDPSNNSHSLGFGYHFDEGRAFKIGSLLGKSIRPFATPSYAEVNESVNHFFSASVNPRP